MPWFAAIGGWILTACAASAATITAYAVVVGVVATVVVGAAVGAIYAGVTGGNILKGALYGAVGACAIVAGGGALAGMSGGAGTAGAVGTESTVGWVGAGSEVAGAGTSLFSTNTVMMATAMGSMGSAFMKGEAETDNTAATMKANAEALEKNLAFQASEGEKNREAQLAAAGMQAASASERNASAEKIAAADRDFAAEKFNKEFEESIYRDRETRAEVERARERSEAGILAARDYIAGDTGTASPTVIQNLRRELTPPTWSTRRPAETGAIQQTPEVAANTPGQPTEPTGGQVQSPVVPQTEIQQPSVGLLGA